MKGAASSGPIILINVSHRCDAFLIEKTGIRIVALPDLHLPDVREKSKRMKSIRQSSIRSDVSQREMFRILEWLWDAVVDPILDKLGIRETPKDGNLPRVWWVPTNLLTLFPLHAAGYHFSKDRKTALDRVVSSYSPSVKALLQAKDAGSVRNSNTTTPYKAVLVSMPSTADLPNSSLPFAKDEISELTHLLAKSKCLKAIPLERPLRSEVIEALRDCTIFHFAGHGKSSIRDPSQSSLLLSDWRTNSLTVGDLMDLKLYENQSEPWLGYLSACSTGENQVHQLLDEGIHLMNACQLAGFRHVVGSLWELSDRECVDVAKKVYMSMLKGGIWLSDEAIAKGLHAAVKELRDRLKAEDGGDLGGKRDPRWKGEELLLPIKELAQPVIPNGDTGTDSRGGSTNGGKKVGLTEQTGANARMRNADVLSSQTFEGLGVGNPLIWASYIHIGV
jgi:CHAT domain-containing protein